MTNDNLVVVPTYNEAQNLSALVESILDEVNFHVLVVDDNSPDGTGTIADQLSARYSPYVSVLHREGKQGLGTAYRAGFTYALARGYRHIFEMDADFSHDPRALPMLREALDEADVVLGSRY